MKIYLSSDFAQETFLQEKLQFIRPNEPIMIRLDKIPFNRNQFVKALTSLKEKTDSACMEFPLEEFLLLKQLGILVEGIQLLVKIKLTNDFGSVYEGVGEENIGNHECLQTYLKIKESLPNHKISFNFDLDNSELTQLGPTVYRLYKEGCRIFFFDSSFEPTLKKVNEVRNAFNYLDMAGADKAQIYFNLTPFKTEWNLHTRNTYSGLTSVAIDISNKCTHSCHFCGLYGADAMAKNKELGGGVIPEGVRKFMSQEINHLKAIELIKSLPWTVENIQFGGAGDPLLHPHWLEIFTAARNRGIRVEVLSNMEYLDDAKVLALHKLGDKIPESMQFILNCSGADVETYVRTRPKQKPEVFHRLIKNLQKFNELKEKDNGSGISFKIMCVVTKLNFKEGPKFVELASSLKAEELWLKPLEVHDGWMRKYSLNQDDRTEFKSILKETIELSKSKDVRMFEPELLQAIIAEATA